MEIVISMKSNQTIIGVDPGKQGYITVMRKSGIVHYPMPKVGKELDPHELSELIVRISEECDAENTMVVIEDVHALHNSAASATWNFGFVCGMLRMAFIMCGLPIVLVSPALLSEPDRFHHQISLFWRTVYLNFLLHFRLLSFLYLCE
jgi:hypothetical protein